jgi:hypothetical protein
MFCELAEIVEALKYNNYGNCFQVSCSYLLVLYLTMLSAAQAK